MKQIFSASFLVLCIFFLYIPALIGMLLEGQLKNLEEFSLGDLLAFVLAVVAAYNFVVSRLGEVGAKMSRPLQIALKAILCSVIILFISIRFSKLLRFYSIDLNCTPNCEFIGFAELAKFPEYEAVELILVLLLAFWLIFFFLVFDEVPNAESLREFVHKSLKQGSRSGNEQHGAWGDQIEKFRMAKVPRVKTFSKIFVGTLLIVTLVQLSFDYSTWRFLAFLLAVVFSFLPFTLVDTLPRIPLFSVRYHSADGLLGLQESSWEKYFEFLREKEVDATLRGSANEQDGGSITLCQLEVEVPEKFLDKKLSEEKISFILPVKDTDQGSISLDQLTKILPVSPLVAVRELKLDRVDFIFPNRSLSTRRLFYLMVLLIFSSGFLYSEWHFAQKGSLLDQLALLVIVLITGHFVVCLKMFRDRLHFAVGWSKLLGFRECIRGLQKSFEVKVDLNDSFSSILWRMLIPETLASVLGRIWWLCWPFCISNRNWRFWLTIRGSLKCLIVRPIQGF